MDSGQVEVTSQAVGETRLTVEVPEVQLESGEGIIEVAQVTETGTQDGKGDGVRVVDTCAGTDGVG